MSSSVRLVGNRVPLPPLYRSHTRGLPGLFLGGSSVCSSVVKEIAGILERVIQVRWPYCLNDRLCWSVRYPSELVTLWIPILVASLMPFSKVCIDWDKVWGWLVLIFESRSWVISVESVEYSSPRFSAHWSLFSTWLSRCCRLLWQWLSWQWNWLRSWWYSWFRFGWRLGFGLRVVLLLGGELGLSYGVDGWHVAKAVYLPSLPLSFLHISALGAASTDMLLSLSMLLLESSSESSASYRLEHDDYRPLHPNAIVLLPVETWPIEELRDWARRTSSCKRTSITSLTPRVKPPGRRMGN